MYPCCTRAVPLLVSGQVKDSLGSVEDVALDSEVASSLIQDVAPY